MVEKHFKWGFSSYKRQVNANHNDIVAVSIDNEATLKTLNLNGEYPVLMPAIKLTLQFL